MHRPPGRLFQRASPPPQRFTVQRVDLGHRGQARLVGQAVAISLQLADDGAIVPGDGRGRAIHQMQQHRAAFDMGQELVAQPAPLARAFDQAGNVGHHEFLAVDPDDAKVRHQRGEGVIRDLRPRVRGGGKEGRLARIRQPQQSRIGDQLQPQPQGALHPLLAGVGAARRLVGGALELQVAPAAIAAARQQHTLARRGQVGDERLFVLVEDLGAHRHLQHDVLAGLAGALAAHAVLARPRKEMLLIAKVDQRVQPLDRLGPDRSAVATVTAIGAAELDILVAPEADAAAAAAARADVDFGQVEEFHRVASGLAARRR